MRATTFIASRLYSERLRNGESRGAVRPAVRVALLGIIIGVLVMVTTVCVVVGFKRTVTEKIAGFSAHIQVVNYDNNNTFELHPILLNDSLVRKIMAMDNVESVFPFYTKPGILKTDDAFEGIVLKGTDDWSFFSRNLVEGSLPQSPNEVLISATQARTLRLAVGETILAYFVDEQVRARKLKIVGIYRTGFGDFDAMFVLSQPDVVRRLNGWQGAECSGLEVRVASLSLLEETTLRVYFSTANRLDEAGNALYTQNLISQNPQIFAWLDLLNMNVVVIILLMLAVSGFSIISGLILLILDSVQMIGVLKALGATNRFIRTIFIKQACMLVGRGMVWGNLLALTLCGVQYFFHLLPLDAATYYVDYVPMAFPWGWIILLNIGTIVLSCLILIGPSAIISRISPARVMHFE